MVRRIAVVLILSAGLQHGASAAQSDVLPGNVPEDTQPMPIADAATCRAGAECLVEGAVRLSKRRGIRAARIDTTSGCFAVALSKSQRHLIRDRQAARIRGFAYGYYATPNVKYYRVRDRWSGTGRCASGTMLYATAVEPPGTPAE